MSEYQAPTDEQTAVAVLATPEADSTPSLSDEVTSSADQDSTDFPDDTQDHSPADIEDADKGGVPQVMAGDDGIERHLVGAAPALRTYDPTPSGGNAALDSVPLVIAAPAVPHHPRSQVHTPVGLVPVRPRGPKPDWYRGPERDGEPVTTPAGSGMVISDTTPARVPLAKPGLVRVTSDHVRALSERVPVTGKVTPIAPVTPGIPVGRTPLAPVAPLTPTPSLPMERVEAVPVSGGSTPSLPVQVPVTPVVQATPVQSTPSLPVAAPSLPMQAPATPLAPVTPVVEGSPSPALTEADTEVPDWAAIRPADDDAQITLTPSLPETPQAPAADIEAQEGEGYSTSLPVVRPTLPVQRPTLVTPVTPAVDDSADQSDESDDLDEEGEDEDYTESEAAPTLLGRPTLPVVRPTLATVPDMPEATSKATLLPDVETGASFDDEEDDEDDFYDEAEEGTDAGAASTSHRASKPLGIKVTDRDLVMLQFLTRYKYATYPQIAEYLGTSVNALRQRLPRMKKAGLITSDNGGPTSYLVWRPTDNGVKLSGFDMRAPSLSWGAVNHTLGLVDLGIKFEKKEVVVTEREIRAADSRDRPSDRMAAALAYHASTSVDSDEAPLYVVALGKGDAQYSHIPDMVLVRQPQPDGTPMSVAIELELVRKPPAQWRKVLLAYKNSNNIGGVMYFTHKKQIKNGIEKIAAELNMSDMVRVLAFIPAEGSKIPMPDTPATA